MPDPRYDLLGPYRGPCAFCSSDDTRHRTWDAIVARERAGEELPDLALDYDLPLRTIARMLDRAEDCQEGFRQATPEDLRTDREEETQE